MIPSKKTDWYEQVLRWLTSRSVPAVVALAAACATLWLWRCWCLFPSLFFNEVRLEPSFLLANGFSVYPGPGEGPVTTWIYGPTTPLLFLPATLASSAAAALMAAGAINTIIVVGSVLLVCALWPAPAGSSLTTSDRIAAGLLCIAVWPASSFQFIQADNVAVAFGLEGNLLLVRSRSDGSRARWLAALAAVAAVGSKQTALGVVIAQVIWLGWTEGRRSAVHHAIRVAAGGIALALATVAYFGPRGLWLNLVSIPAQLPWTDQGGIRLSDLAPLLAVHIGAPLFVLVLARRRIWYRESPLLFPALAWTAALPFGVASLLKIGGNINSLESLLLFLPPALLIFCVSQRSGKSVRDGLAVAALCILLFRIGQTPAALWRPRVAHLHQAKLLTEQLPGKLWFPWNPLITFYSDHRFDHVEDGLYVRFVAGQPLTRAEARMYLPPDWHGMALRRGDSDWGLATHLCPPNAEVREVGFWTLHVWSAPNSAVTAPQ